MITIAESIIHILESLNIKRIYGIGGDSLNAFTEAIRERQTIEWISVRHEEVAAFAAGSEAQLSQSLAVCAGSCGPGNLHLINGLYDCHRNGVPVLAIAAQIPSSEIGSSYFQETHPERIFQECSCFCETLSQADQMPRLAEMAIQKALGKPGVAVLIISGDVAWKKTSAPSARDFFGFHPQHFSGSSDQHVDNIAVLLQEAKKTAIFAGVGCRHAREEVLELAERLQAPIVHTFPAKEILEYDNPFYVGMTGLLGISSGYQTLMECDLLLLLGNDFPYRQFYPKDVITIQVDIRAENIGRRTDVDYALIGDVKTVLCDLNSRIQKKKDNLFLNRCLQQYKNAREQLDAAAIESPQGRPIHPQYLTKLISELADGDAIFTFDVGTPTIWAARYLTMNRQRKLLGSFRHGSMAAALPQAIGAQFESPGKQVIALTGDGGLAMLLGDLITLKQYQLPIKVIVFNNGAYGFVELEQKSAGLMEYGTKLENPDFAKVAEAMGIPGKRIQESSELPEAIKEAFQQEGPVLLEVLVDRHELAMPPKIFLSEMAGFGIYSLTAILNGQADQLIELVRTNVINK